MSDNKVRHLGLIQMAGPIFRLDARTFSGTSGSTSPQQRFTHQSGVFQSLGIAQNCTVRGNERRTGA